MIRHRQWQFVTDRDLGRALSLGSFATAELDARNFGNVAGTGGESLGYDNVLGLRCSFTP